MAPADLVGVGRFLEPLEREFADRLQHRVARLVAAEQVLVEQRAERVDVCVADGLGAFQRPAARKDGEARERPPFMVVQKVVAPSDRRSQRSLPLRRIARARGQQRQSLLEPFEQLRRRKHVYARGRQLDRKRQPVQPRADCSDDRPVAAKLERGSLDEQRDRLRICKRRHCVLALGHDPERLAAGREHVDSDNISRKVGNHRRDSGKQLLEIVENEEEPPRAQVVAQHVAVCPAAALAQAERLRDRSHDQIRIRQRPQRHEPDAVGVVLGGVGGREKRQARLPAAARADQGDDRDIVAAEQVEQLGELALTPDELSRRDREIRLVQRLERREVLAAELVEPLWFGEVLESVLAQVAHEHAVVEQCPGRFAEQHLAAVSRRHYARRPVHVASYVALVGDERRPGVKAHTHVDGTGRQRFREHGRGRESTGRRREGEEEGVALRIDLDSVLGGACLPDDPTVLGERLGVGLRAELVQELRRALDVREEEGDGACRKIVAHAG